MKTKQIFEAYNRQGNRAIDTLRYCPRCGARFDLICSEGQSRLRRPRCGLILYQNPSPGAVVSGPFPAMAFEADRHIINR